jgi:acyl carrier protein
MGIGPAIRFSEGQCERDFRVDDKQILDIVHQMAAEMTDVKDGEVVEYGSVVSAESADNLIDRYGFSSIDTLKYLLTLEEKFGVALADEDFNEELLLSATALARHIAALRQADDEDLGRRSVLALGSTPE